MTHQMKLTFAAACLCLLATATISEAQEKWSRQVDVGDASAETDSLDWIPLAQPADGNAKERAGRVLSYAPQQQQFPPAQQKPSYYSSQVQPQQSQFDFGPFQYSRFGNLPQTQPLRQTGLRQQQEPTSQSFFKFEMPFHGDGGRPLGAAGAGPTLQTGYQISHGFGGQSSGGQSSIFSSPLFNQQPLFPPEFHPLPQKPLQQRLQHQKPLTQQNFIDDIFPLKSSLKETKPLPTQQSLRNVSPQVFPVDPQPESVFDLSKPTSFQLQSPYQATASPAVQQQPQSANAGTQQQQQEVQLLYVPYETLFNQQQQQRQPQPQAQPATAQQQNSQYEVNKFNFNAGLPAVNPYQINQFYTQDPLASNFYTTSSTLRPTTTSTTPATSIKQNIFDSFVSSLTTPKPKPKAHQPPLAMFILRSSARTTQADVVAALRQASTIAVIDAPTQQTPDIFVGPAGMPIPQGFVKFDLPYLSQLAHTRDLNDVPFFVAPLSYRTPNGFNKILLPEPHVGSIVVNRAKDTQYEAQQQSTAAAPAYDVTTPRTRTTTKRIKQHPNVKDYYVDPYEATTQRATLAPTRGNKFSYYYANEGIQEVTSPKLPKQDRPKKKRPQNVKIEEDPTHQSALNNLFAQFNPIPNQIPNEDYFRLQSPQPQPQPQTRPTTTSTSTSTSTTTTTTTSTPTPPALFTYNTSPQVDFKGTHGQLYHDFGKPEPVEQEYVPRFTTRPPPSTTLDDEYRMKQYFRQQDAFRNRPQVVQPTNSPYEEIQDFERQTTTQRPSTTTNQRAPVYIQQTQNNDNDNRLPANHRPAYQNQNEINDANVEYEPNPYQLPSELPQLAPNLPGLVNNLQEEKDKQNAIEQSQPTTEAYEPEPATRQPTRRPINRVRKPVVSKVTSSVSYSESESEVSRRPATRIRRPYGSRGSASTASAAADNEGSTTTTTTRRPSAGRNNLLRNPNRIRYQPTPEERQSLRLKPKKRYGGSKKNENEDLEYQRDVLNQNYPVIKPLSSRKPTSPTAIPSSYAITTTETPAAETQQVYTVTPSNHLDRDNEFPVGLLAQMDIAQQYNAYSKDNYGPGYFPNQEDLNPTEPVIRNEIYTTQPPATTTTTPAPTTTEEPQTTTTTRRSPFVRRTYPRLRTTTEAPVTTTEATEQRASTRPRIPPRKVIKVRQRTRRPLHPASTTNLPEEETNDAEPARNNNYRKYSRYSQQENNENESPAPQPHRRRFKPQVQLEGQESQWSPAKTGDSTNFKPIEPKESRGYNKHRFEDEPEIVTAGAEPETYEFNVGANYGPSTTRTTLQEPNLKPEKSFAELLEEVMGKTTDEPTTAAQTTSGTYFESQKTTIANRIKERRGKWRKANQKGTSESFETAESQNIGAQLANSLYAQNKDTEAADTARSLKATTPSSNDYTTITQPMTTTIVAPSDYDVTTQASRHDTTTTKAYETTADTTEAPMPTTTASSLDEATSRMDTDGDNAQPSDDLESQPSLFFEVKRQLHELFAIEENEDQAVTAALAAVGRRRQEYTNIRRTKPETPVTPSMDAAVSTTEATSSDGKKEFHKDLMKNVVYATSQTATKSETPAETEICYRGRCIRSEDLPANHKLH